MTSITNKIQSNLHHLREVKREMYYQINDWSRILWQSNSIKKVVNQKEIRVVGLRRSGNHAIINWIRNQHTGKACHLNNIRPDKSPYRNLYFHYQTEKLKQESIGNFSPKDCLMYSYEDYPLEAIATAEWEKKHDLYVGKSRKKYDVLIIRDPLNLLASRLKRKFMDTKANDWSVVDLWIAYAKEYLGETNYLSNNKICINYNHWFSDAKYRQSLASQLDCKFSDYGFDQVKSEGGGSSFDGRKFNGSATQMNVLNRWQHFVDNREYLQLLNNCQLQEYYEKIFDYVPGTEVLFATKMH